MYKSYLYQPKKKDLLLYIRTPKKQKKQDIGLFKDILEETCPVHRVEISQFVRVPAEISRTWQVNTPGS